MKFASPRPVPYRSLLLMAVLAGCASGGRLDGEDGGTGTFDGSFDDAGTVDAASDGGPLDSGSDAGGGSDSGTDSGTDGGGGGDSGSADSGADAPAPTCVPSGAGWVEIEGGPEVSSSSHGLALLPGGGVALGVLSGMPRHFQVHAFEDGAWGTLGGPRGAEGENSSVPLLAYGDALYSMYGEEGTDGQIRPVVATWDGGSWERLGAGDIGNGTPHTAAGAISATPGGGLLIHWIERDEDLGATRFGKVYEWAGIGWVEQGGMLGAGVGSGIFYPGASRLGSDWLVSYSESNAAHLLRLVGGVATPLPGSPLMGEGSLFAPRVASRGEQVWVAYAHSGIEFTETTIRTLSGEMWSDVAANISHHPGSSPAVPQDLEVDSEGRPVVAITEPREGVRNSSSIYIYRGASMLGAPFGDPETHYSFPNLAIDECDQPVLSFAERSGDTTTIRVFRYED